MQDMATRVISPDPAPPGQDSASTTGVEMHETSRTDADAPPDSSPTHRSESDQSEDPMEISDERPDSAMRYVCPICDKTLSSQHDFTLHIRSHNNANEVEMASIVAKGYACKICSKVLSSSSSLDRHVLVHSGERPFKCRVCAVAFTTNGNMHRHMRTHSSPKSNDYESDGSTDSTGSLNHNGKSPSPTNNNNNNNNVSAKKRRVMIFDNDKSPDVSPETNNNNKRKVSDVLGSEMDVGKRRMKNLEFCTPQRYQCPVCEREDFASLNVLETHLESAHPDYKIRCRSCDLEFKNHRVLNLHRFMVHHDRETSDNYNSVLGFKDLTFMDFSSEKFPHIARAMCEQKMHQPAVACASFTCERCGRAFPCGSALNIHRQACPGDEGYPTDLSSQRASSHSDQEEEEERKREDFFAGLDLQNKSIPTSPTTPERRFERAAYLAETKDLADIQSIISVTNAGGLRLQDLTKSPVVNGSLTPSDKSYSDVNEEEQQDCFASEFRKMKLKGEFPCRLCSSVFPNLRALKGHNRAHLVSGTVFRCNMCPYANPDKAILIRHMRSHNGDRPYECALCNYAFTTKANCERHLRNRHSKLAREDVKKSIIYHPSEDPTNDLELQAKISSDVKRSLNFDHSEEHSQSERFEEKYQSKVSLEKSKMINFDRDRFERHSPAVERPWDTHEVATMTSPNCDDSETSESDEDDDVSKNNSHNAAYTPYRRNVNSPLDLTMDVLDLSKKPASKPSGDEPQDLSKKTLEFNNNVTSHLQAQLLARPASPAKQMPKVELNLSSFYPTPPHAIYLNNNTFPFPGQPYMNPYFLPQQHPLGMLPPASLQEFAEMRERSLKELIRGLQMSGGTMLDPIAMATAADKLQQLHQQALVEFTRSKEIKFEMPEERVQIKEEKVKLPPTKMPVKPRERDNSSVKMVIKNGVLMPKQKQRRYRTERPFFCEHCSARFTLRSNMERHIKQQHPEFWTQRQRGNIAGGRRNLGMSQDSSSHGDMKPQSPTIHIPALIPFSQHFDLKPKPIDELYEAKEKLNILNNNNNKVFISNEVKNAIAQQLKSKLSQSKSLDDEGELVIDEEDEDVEDKVEEEAKNLKNVGFKTEPVRIDLKGYLKEAKDREAQRRKEKKEESVDLASVSRMLDNATTQTQTFQQYFRGAQEEEEGHGEEEEEDEEGLVAASDHSGSDENRSDLESNTATGKKKSAYSLAPNRVSCPYCHRKFPWSSSLRRHVLTHTGQKPYKCAHCPLLFTTKSNCDRHLLRKHANSTPPSSASPETSPTLSQAQTASYTMRNVPERPYKCNHCPSSTFSTLSNLKKHVSTKHSAAKANEEAASNDESQESEEDEEPEVVEKAEVEVRPPGDAASTTSSTSDLPFKCHLCEGSYGERQEALEHIKENHPTEFMLLVSKGALEAGGEDNNNGNEEATPGEESLEQLRGKFPDYANRKVMCAFCLRRFWSAEDLRRHMRTHTGERPFSCDICRRRFTLKHSMLRHRKKHSAADAGALSGDEDSYKVEKTLKGYLAAAVKDNGFVENGKKVTNHNNNNIKVPSSRYIMENPWPGARSQEDRKEGEEDTDLIGNLLGIQDKSIIDKMLLSKSADDAAMLLGVGRRE